MAPAYCEGETNKELIKTRTESGKCFCIRVFLSFKLRFMSTNLECRERERQRKRESRATGQKTSTRIGASLCIAAPVFKKQKETFLLDEQYEIL